MQAAGSWGRQPLCPRTPNPYSPGSHGDTQTFAQKLESPLFYVQEPTGRGWVKQLTNFSAHSCLCFPEGRLALPAQPVWAGVSASAVHTCPEGGGQVAHLCDLPVGSQRSGAKE